MAGDDELWRKHGGKVPPGWYEFIDTLSRLRNGNAITAATYAELRSAGKALAMAAWECGAEDMADAALGAPGRERTGFAPGELEYASWFTASTAYMAGCSYCNGDCPSPQACGRAEHLAAGVPEAPALKRPDNFEFAMEFLGDPEATTLREYIEALERAAGVPEVDRG